MIFIKFIFEYILLFEFGISRNLIFILIAIEIDRVNDM